MTRMVLAARAGVAAAGAALSEVSSSAKGVTQPGAGTGQGGRPPGFFSQRAQKNGRAGKNAEAPPKKLGGRAGRLRPRPKKWAGGQAG